MPAARAKITPHNSDPCREERTHLLGHCSAAPVRALQCNARSCARTMDDPGVNDYEPKAQEASVASHQLLEMEVPFSGLKN